MKNQFLKMVILGGVMIIWGTQPLLMMASLVLLVLVYCIYLYFSTGSFWFSYVLVLVMLSGILVIFSYMLSIYPNNEFEGVSFFPGGLMIVFIYFYSEGYYLLADFSIMTISLWEISVGVMTLYMVVFLLGVMIMVVWLSVVKAGPLC